MADLESFKARIAEGDVDAMYLLGVKYQKADGVKQDIVKAIELFEKAAALGHNVAMNALGVIYDNGHGGISKDFGLALYWFHQAADAGCIPAMKNLGIVFEYGRAGLLAKDEQRAFDFYKMAADRGNEPAKEAVRRLEVNLRPMSELEAKADELRDAEQQFQIGRRYHNGLNCPQNIVHAIQWYERAVQNGHAGAANNLGVIFDNGPSGVEKSYEKAFHYFSIGGERGSNVAMKNLGIMHEDGRGDVVPKDKVISLEWYGKAAAAGNEYARERLVNLLSRTEVPILIKAYSGDADAMFEVGQKWESGLLYPQSARKAAEFYERAVVVKKHVGAANALALMFVKGTGVTVDTSRAFKLWQVAADAGHPEAMYHIGVSYSKESLISSVAPDPLLAFHYFQASAAGGYAPAVEALSRLQSVSELSQQRTQTDMLEMCAQRSESPSPSVCFEIGRRFAVGLGRSADVSSAIQWYQRAVDAASTALSDHSLLSTISPDATVLCGAVYQERKQLYENGQKVHQQLIDAALQEIARPRPEPPSSDAAAAAEVPNELPEGCVPDDSPEGAGEPSEVSLPLLDLPSDSFTSAAVYVRTEASFALGRLLDQPEGPASPIKSPAQHVVRRDSAAALRHLQVAAQYWHAGAMQQVAAMYEDGRGADCERDTAAALIWYARAAKHGSELAHDRLTSLMSQKIADQMIKAVGGDSEAVYQIANKLDEGDDNMPKSQRISLQWYERALELGNAAAANNLGVLYDNGKGVERCAVKAVQYFTQSAELGSQWAMKNLGIIYEYGRDGLIPRSLSDAVKWYSRSAEKGNEQAQQALRRIKAEEDNDRERDTPVELLRRRAFDGNRHAMFQLGCRYYNGEREKEKEREREREKEREREREARKRDKSKDKVKDIAPEVPRVVLQPFVDVESFVPTPCLQADSVDGDTPELQSPPPQGYEEALYWFTRAAMAGHAGAYNYCGVCYDNGKGCVKDAARAFECFTKGALAGDLVSMKNLGIVFENGRAGVVDKSAEAALEWYGRGAFNGHQWCKDQVNKALGKQLSPMFLRACGSVVEAQFALGMRFERGSEPKLGEHPAKAVRWYWRAFEGGDGAHFGTPLKILPGGHIEISADEVRSVLEHRSDTVHVGAAVALARLMDAGNVIKRDSGSALEILRFAVEHRQHESYFLLGDMYELGRPGVLGQNRIKAAQLFAMSAEASRLAAINHTDSANASSVSASAASSHALAAASAQTICKEARVRLTALVSPVTAEMLIQSCIEPDSEEHPRPAALIEAAQLFEKGRAAVKAVPGVSPGFPGLAGSAILALEWYRRALRFGGPSVIEDARAGCVRMRAVVSEQQRVMIDARATSMMENVEPVAEESQAGWPMQSFSRPDVARLFVCRLCKNILKVACRLPCGHVFCRQCISTHSRSGTQTTLLPSKFAAMLVDQVSANQQSISDSINAANTSDSTDSQDGSSAIEARVHEATTATDVDVEPVDAVVESPQQSVETATDATHESAVSHTEDLPPADCFHCPIDRRSVELSWLQHDDSTSAFHQRRVDELAVVCRFQSRGCTAANVPLKELDSHHLTCLFRDVRCLECGFTGLRDDVQQHLRAECARRIVLSQLGDPLSEADDAVAIDKLTLNISSLHDELPCESPMANAALLTPVHLHVNADEGNLGARSVLSPHAPL